MQAHDRPRIALLWPRPRRDRIAAAARDPESMPDQSDALMLLRGEGFDVVVEDPCGIPWNPLARAHGLWSGLDPLRALRVRRRRPPYDAVVAVDASSALFARSFLPDRVAVVIVDPAVGGSRMRERILNRTIPSADRIVVFAQAQAAALRARYGDRVRTEFIPHRADVRFFDPALPRVTPGRRPYVLAIGDVSRDFATLIRACAVDAPLGRALARHDAQCVLHTPLALGALPPRVVHSAGRISFPELRDLYRDAAVVALPLHDLDVAGGVNSLVEAMAMVRPVVLSRSRGIVDYVSDGENALLVPVGDAAALGDAVVRVLDDEALARRLASAARAPIVERCAGPVYARNLAGVLREAIRARPGRPPAEAPARPT